MNYNKLLGNSKCLTSYQNFQSKAGPPERSVCPSSHVTSHLRKNVIFWQSETPKWISKKDIKINPSWIRINNQAILSAWAEILLKSKPSRLVSPSVTSCLTFTKILYFGNLRHQNQSQVSINEQLGNPKKDSPFLLFPSIPPGPSQPDPRPYPLALRPGLPAGSKALPAGSKAHPVTQLDPRPSQSYIPTFLHAPEIMRLWLWHLWLCQMISNDNEN